MAYKFRFWFKKGSTESPAKFPKLHELNQSFFPGLTTLVCNILEFCSANNRNFRKFLKIKL